MEKLLQYSSLKPDLRDVLWLSNSWQVSWCGSGHKEFDQREQVSNTTSLFVNLLVIFIKHWQSMRYMLIWDNWHYFKPGVLKAHGQCMTMTAIRIFKWLKSDLSVTLNYCKSLRLYGAPFNWTFYAARLMLSCDNLHLPISSNMFWLMNLSCLCVDRVIVWLTWSSNLLWSLLFSGVW